MRRQATDSPCLSAKSRPNLGRAIARIRARLHRIVEEALASVKADRVVGTSENDALDALAARGFEHVATALDVHRQELVPCVFFGNAGKVHDAVDTGHALFHRRQVTDVDPAYFLAGRSLAQRCHVGEPKRGIDAAQSLAQCVADLARRAGDKDAMHAIFAHRMAFSVAGSKTASSASEHAPTGPGRREIVFGCVSLRER
jgi:hypothetical protein